MDVHAALDVAIGDKTSDAILRSCDGKDFRVHKLVLADVSSYFKEVFSANNARRNPVSSDPHVGGILVIADPETKVTVSHLLSHTYRNYEYGVASSRTVCGVLSAPRKYNMHEIIDFMDEEFFHECQRSAVGQRR